MKAKKSRYTWVYVASVVIGSSLVAQAAIHIDALPTVVYAKFLITGLLMTAIGVYRVEQITKGVSK